MGRILAALAALLVATGCSSPTATETATTTTTTTTSAAAAAPSSTTRPSSPLSPNGFGATPPTREQLLAFGAWMDGPGRGAKAATGAVSKSVDLMNQAVADADLSGLRNACRDITDSLTIRLPASLPAPDQDVTNALQFVVDDGTVLESACNGLDDPPTDGQLTAVEDAIHQLGADLKTVGTIFMRDGDLLKSEAKRH